MEILTVIYFILIHFKASFHEKLKLHVCKTIETKRKMIITKCLSVIDKGRSGATSTWTHWHVEPVTKVPSNHPSKMPSSYLSSSLILVLNSLSRTMEFIRLLCSLAVWNWLIVLSFSDTASLKRNIHNKKNK